jgi:hypothetical protein
LDALYGSGSPHLSFDPVMGLNTATQDGILNFVMAAMFIMLPTFWVTALGWTGLSVGSYLGGLAEGTKHVQQAGGKAGGMIEGAIKK